MNKSEQGRIRRKIKQKTESDVTTSSSPVGVCDGSYPKKVGLIKEGETRFQRTASIALAASDRYNKFTSTVRSEGAKRINADIGREKHMLGGVSKCAMRSIAGEMVTRSKKKSSTLSASGSLEIT